jgi:hypothetical protein
MPKLENRMLESNLYDEGMSNLLYEDPITIFTAVKLLKEYILRPNSSPSYFVASREAYKEIISPTDNNILSSEDEIKSSSTIITEEIESEYIEEERLKYETELKFYEQLKDLISQIEDIKIKKCLTIDYYENFHRFGLRLETIYYPEDNQKINEKLEEIISNTNDKLQSSFDKWITKAKKEADRLVEISKRDILLDKILAERVREALYRGIEKFRSYDPARNRVSTETRTARILRILQSELVNSDELKSVSTKRVVLVNNRKIATTNTHIRNELVFRISPSLYFDLSSVRKLPKGKKYKLKAIPNINTDKVSKFEQLIKELKEIIKGTYSDYDLFYYQLELFEMTEKEYYEITETTKYHKLKEGLENKAQSIQVEEIIEI